MPPARKDLRSCKSSGDAHRPQIDGATDRRRIQHRWRKHKTRPTAAMAEVASAASSTVPAPTIILSPNAAVTAPIASNAPGEFNVISSSRMPPVYKAPGDRHDMSRGRNPAGWRRSGVPGCLPAFPSFAIQPYYFSFILSKYSFCSCKVLVSAFTAFSASTSSPI